MPLVTVIVYDLPNRGESRRRGSWWLRGRARPLTTVRSGLPRAADCHAKASNGEICCVPNPDGTCNYDSAGDGTCSAGLATYKSQYIDVLAAVLAEYPQVPVVGIVGACPRPFGLACCLAATSYPASPGLGSRAERGAQLREEGAGPAPCACLVPHQ